MGYEPIETASVEELRALQTERFTATVRRAYDRVEHYRVAFDTVGVDPGDIKGLEDLSGLPFLTKDDLRRNYPFKMLAVPRRALSRIHASSGTTGKPTVVGYTRNDIETWASLVARSIYAAGGRPGDVIHQGYGYGLFTGGLGLHFGAERLGCAVVPMGGGQTEKQVQLITDLEPRIITVTPSYCFNLIEQMQRQGIDPASCSLQIGIFGAEPWTDGMRVELETRLGIDATDIYGLSEVMGPGVAQECVETKDGPTIWEDHFYPEVIDPDTGDVLPDGTEGELVITSLTKEAFPVIRYRTRDITTLLPGTARTMRRLGRITGRSDDMLIVRGVNVYPSQIEHELLRIQGLTPHYELHRGHDGALATLTVRVESVEQIDNAESARLADVTRSALKAMVGITVAVEVVNPGAIPRSQGKAQRVL